MTCFQVLILWQKNLTATSASGFFHSLLSFLFLVFAKKSARRQAMCSKLLDQTWTMIIVARAFGVAQHYYVIMILILARSYIKRRVVVVVVYAYFLGEISQVDTFSLRACDWPSVSDSLTAHLTGLNQFTVACLRLRRQRWTLLRPLSPRWPCSPRPPSWRSCAAARSMAWCATWGHSPAFAGWGLWIWDSPTLNDQPRPVDGLLDLPFPHRLCHASYASWEVCIFYRPSECWAHMSHLAIYGSISSFSMPEIETMIKSKIKIFLWNRF